jgi:hypothetical protein
MYAQPNLLWPVIEEPEQAYHVPFDVAVGPEQVALLGELANIAAKLALQKLLSVGA